MCTSSILGEKEEKERKKEKRKESEEIKPSWWKVFPELIMFFSAWLTLCPICRSKQHGRLAFSIPPRSQAIIKATAMMRRRLLLCKNDIAINFFVENQGFLSPSSIHIPALYNIKVLFILYCIATRSKKIPHNSRRYTYEPILL